MSGLNGKSNLRKKRAFTLLEVLLATIMFAAIIASINLVFTTAMRMRSTGYNLLEASLPEKQSVEIIRKDLSGCISTGGLLAGRFIGELNGDGIGGTPRMEFFSTTGAVRDDQPWPEVQRVRYYLAENGHISRDSSNRGFELVRGVYRNPLTDFEEDPTEQLLFPNVNRVEFTYFDGEEWYDIWDSENLDTVLGPSTAVEGESERSTLPTAVLMKIIFEEPERNSNERVKNPVEVLVAISAKGIAPVEEEEGE